MNRKVRFHDGTLDAKYLFPFWDAAWTVKFVLVDVLGGSGPRIADAEMTIDGSEIRVARPASGARRLASFAPEEFHGSYHFDPWWVFRGMGGVGEAHRAAVLPTNTARPFRFSGTEMKIHDVEFGPRLETVVRIEAKDHLYRLTVLERGSFDLEKAFGPTGV